MPKVSVIVPVYNVEKYIERCARSLFEQSLQDMEFIFVDDCGEDKSMEILNSVIAEYPNRKVNLIRQPQNLGVSAARETGIDAAIGKYIGFCDSDDWVDASMFERLFEAAELNDAEIAACGYNEIRTDRTTQFTFDRNEDSLDQIFDFGKFGCEYGALWNKLIKREFFVKENQNLGKGLRMWEDSCTLIPLRLKSHKTIFLKACLYNYNVNENSMTTKFSLQKVQDSIEAVNRLEYYFVENGYKKQSKEMLDFLKISAKEVLLRFPTRNNLLLWRTTFPETIPSLLHYSQWNYVLRLRAYLVSMLPFELALCVLKVMRK